MSNNKSKANQTTTKTAETATKEVAITAQEGAAIRKKKATILVAFVLVIVIIVGVIALAVTFIMPSPTRAFALIKRNNNYSYQAIEARPLLPTRKIFISQEKHIRAIDTGVNKFVVDYALSKENCGVFTEINNIWIYEEVFKGEEGTGLGKDNRALMAFDVAVEDFLGNYELDKKTGRYSIKKESYPKIFTGSGGGTCEIYKKSGKIFIDVFYGVDSNNKERIIITNVGTINIELPKLTDLTLE